MSDHQPHGVPPQAEPIRRSTLALGATLLVIAAVAIVVIGLVPRLHARQLLAEQSRQATPTVSVTHPQQSAPEQEIVLPSNIQAYVDAPIYARTSGYLKSWKHDIGSHVRKGELLAVIESPEVDQQLAQAQADLQTSQANAKLADITAARYTELLKTDSVSQQDTDNAVQQAQAQHATVASQQANVRRLQQLVAFEQVYAPFDGVVTQRNTDVGQLINAGAGSPASQLFQLSDVHTLRVFVGVPQQDSAACKPGSAAYLTLDQFPGRKFAGSIARTSDAIDPNTRTLNVEIDIPNPAGDLLPGAYAQVHVPVLEPQQTVTLPVSALIFRTEGLRVATVVDGKARLVPILQGRDFGSSIEVVSGLSATDEVITNPPDAVTDGMAVRVIPPALQQKSQPQGGK